MLKIAFYQKFNLVGSLEDNFNSIAQFYLKHQTLDLVVTPELSLTGYIPKDVIFLKDFAAQVAKYQEALRELTKNKQAHLVVGSIVYNNQQAYNVALVFSNNKLIQTIIKQKLPNYGIFSELRFFNTKPTNNIININNTKVALAICEDLWHNDFLNNLKTEQPDLCISINASPFEITKDFSKVNQRLEVANNAAKILQCAVFYLNTVGGFDEIVFDGASFAVSVEQKVLGYMNFFAADECIIEHSNKTINSVHGLVANTWLNKNELIYQAIMLSLKDFIKNNGFTGVLLALSGGIDSAITAVMVADALGAENLTTVFMPSIYSNPISNEIVHEMNINIGFSIQTLNIDTVTATYEKLLNNTLNLETNNVAENLQARIRGQIIMAFANNKPTHAVLTTGNKSEIATGYSTLYGDTVGAFNLLKDIYKTDIYELSKWRNNNIPKGSKLKQLNVLPQKVIDRRASAELKDNQFDEDNLMPYEILDNIFYNAIELNKSNNELYNMFEANLVNKALTLLHNSHYKRVQSAIGVKISTHSFGSEYNYPLANGFKRLPQTK